VSLFATQQDNPYLRPMDDLEIAPGQEDLPSC
jgi:hypothetical protein